MKKLITRYITGLIPIIAVCACSYAQTNKLNSPLNSPSSKEVAYPDEPTPSNRPFVRANPAANINAKAVKSFNRSHENKTAAKWYAIPDGFVAQYREAGVTTKAYYDSRGHWIVDVLTYMEDKLPKDIRHLVKSTYYDFSIIVVNEVRAGKGTAYLVKMEDNSSIKTIRITDTEMSEMEILQKSM